MQAARRRCCKGRAGRTRSAKVMKMNEQSRNTASAPYSTRDIACLDTVAGLMCWQCYHHTDEMRSHELGHDQDAQLFLVANSYKQRALESMLDIHEINAKNGLDDYTFPMLAACIRCDQETPRMKDGLDARRSARR